MLAFPQLCSGFLALSLALSTLSACLGPASDRQAAEKVLAQIDDLTLTEADLQYALRYLPDFMQSASQDPGLKLRHLTTLIHTQLLAQDARKKNYLSSEALALLRLEAIVDQYLEDLPPLADSLDLSEAQIEARLTQEADALMEPERYVVSYALRKKASDYTLLHFTHAGQRAAQLGYLVVDPPAYQEDAHNASKLRLKNQGGHPSSARFFDLAFCASLNQAPNTTSRLGPFSEKDETIFSCPKALAQLKSASLGVLGPDLSCDPAWQAFAILEARLEAKLPEPEELRLRMRQRILDEAKAESKERRLRGDGLEP